jgi:hypothetical protein
MEVPCYQVKFRFFCEETIVGDTLVVMGDWLGWDQNQALVLECTKYPQWECEACVPSGSRQFKLLLLRSDLERKWESLENNRTMEVEKDCSVEGTFGKVTRDEPTGPRKSCQRCGSIVSPYSNCPKCWGPVTSQKIKAIT